MNNYFSVVNCETENPPRMHEFTTETVEGHYIAYGEGQMRLRRCLKCGLIEYSHFKGIGGKEVDVDALFRLHGR